jgi:hypothetical protein
MRRTRRRGERRRVPVPVPARMPRVRQDRSSGPWRGRQTQSHRAKDRGHWQPATTATRRGGGPISVFNDVGLDTLRSV